MFTIRSVVLVIALLISGCAPIPTKSEPEAYAQALVQDAIRFYKREGLQAAIDRYSSSASVDGQWYVTMTDVASGTTIAHPDTSLIGADATAYVDITGYEFGKEAITVGEDGKWVSYVWENPESGKVERKYTWVVRYDGLIFGSGWYESVDESQ
ncbi:MAG: hypothetical protein F4X14_10395 [Caldilineaceae bacterium SB0661_bin_32]|uniref:Single Cache domain-containing protein n=1 Tax=Caldilineaceae bacterium SB0661_bin_32 TaxID=2605255 RepID=A0A6B1D628_9CHLR|nr:hypothetical protein [Caldilineaceae bacterium SB0661_bin_32]